MSATAGMNFPEAKALAVREQRSQLATGTALRMGPSVALIAAFKRRSPSAGALAGGESAADAARIYVRNGTCALSVLTDADDFGETIEDLEGASAAFGVPVRRKEFIGDERQIVHARWLRCRFVYVGRRSGVTGSGDANTNLADRLGTLRATTSLPLAVGRGVSTRDDVRAAARTAFAEAP